MSKPKGLTFFDVEAPFFLQLLSPVQISSLTSCTDLYDFTDRAML